MLIILVYFSSFEFILLWLMVSHWQESTIEFGHAVDSRFRHFASCFWYCKKTWNHAKNHFWGALNTSLPQKFHFLLGTRDFLRKRVCGFSDWQLQENVFNHANLFGGAIFLFPPINPPNPVSTWVRATTLQIYPSFLGGVSESSILTYDVPHGNTTLVVFSKTLAARGLEEFFSSCAVVSVFGSGGK
jgi:hypothetical protein